MLLTVMCRGARSRAKPFTIAATAALENWVDACSRHSSWGAGTIYAGVDGGEPELADYDGARPPKLRFWSEIPNFEPTRRWGIDFDPNRR